MPDKILLKAGFTSLSKLNISVPNMTAATSMKSMKTTILIALARKAFSRWNTSFWKRLIWKMRKIRITLSRRKTVRACVAGNSRLR